MKWAIRVIGIVRPSAMRSACSGGMPAELYVTTAERTPLQYLAKPILVFAGRAMREP